MELCLHRIWQFKIWDLLTLFLNFSWFKKEGEKAQHNNTTYDASEGSHTNLFTKVRISNFILFILFYFFKSFIAHGSRSFFSSARVTQGNRRTSKNHKGRGCLKDKCVCTVKRKRKFYHLHTGWIKRVLYFPPLLIICWTH